MLATAGLALRLAESARADGLYYREEFLRELEIDLACPHRFVILYGPPGAGKSRLIQLIAQALLAELSIIPVQAGWRDQSPLIGTYDVSRARYLPGALTALALRAAAAPERLFIFCLEELSLGEPEGYLATLLCGLEASPPRLHLNLPAARVDCGEGVIPDEVPLPENILFLGTLCLGRGGRRELPRQLLDRSILCELACANVRAYLATRETPFPGTAPLVEIFELLRSHGWNLGYRVFREIGAAVGRADAAGLAPDRALDQQLKARVLPVVAGGPGEVEDCLHDLVKLLSADEVRFPETLDKAVRMLEELGLHGYTAAYLV